MSLSTTARSVNVFSHLTLALCAAANGLPEMSLWVKSVALRAGIDLPLATVIATCRTVPRCQGRLRNRNAAMRRTEVRFFAEGHMPDGNEVLLSDKAHRTFRTLADHVVDQMPSAAARKIAKQSSHNNKAYSMRSR